VNGIITSHGSLVAAAKGDRVITVQRLLLHDELGLPSALAALERARPDIIEVLPGVIFPAVVGELRARVAAPILVGGFITGPADMRGALDRGARAITTSTLNLWP
jgi:glycerol uptake operon antiterminator